MNGDIYFSLGEVLTLNVKKAKIFKNLTVKKYLWSCTKYALFDKLSHDKMQGSS